MDTGPMGRVPEWHVCPAARNTIPKVCKACHNIACSPPLSSRLSFLVLCSAADADKKEQHSDRNCKMSTVGDPGHEHMLRDKQGRPGA